MNIMKGDILFCILVISASLGQETPSHELENKNKESTVTANREVKPTLGQGDVEGRRSTANGGEMIVNTTSASSNSTKTTEEVYQTGGEFQGQNIPLLDAVSVKVLVAEEDSIAIVDLSTDMRQPLFLEWENINISSVDFHWNKSLVFFAANKKIYRTDFLPVTSQSSIVSQHVEDVRLAVDWVHDKLYWLCDKHQTLEMVNLNGSNRRLLIDNIKHFRFPNNIVVDPYEKLLFFVSDYALFKSDLDGNNIRQISVDGNVRSTPGWGIRNIALDRNNKYIFITGKTPKNAYANSTVFIVKIDYKGSGNMINLLQNAAEWVDIYAMEVFNDVLYFVDYNRTRVDRLNKVQLSEEIVAPKAIYNPRSTDNGIWSIRVVHPCVQMIHNEECQKTMAK